MKELLEEYVMENRNLREQMEFVLKVLDLLISVEGETIDLKKVLDTTPASVTVTQEEVHIDHS